MKNAGAPLSKAVGHVTTGGFASVPKRVKNRHRGTSNHCLVYPQKQTWTERVGMSALCQKRTRALAAIFELGLITWARPYLNGRVPRSQEDPAASDQARFRAG